MGDRLAGVQSARGSKVSLGWMLRTLLPGRKKGDAGGNGRKPVTVAGAGDAQRAANVRDGAATAGGRSPSSVASSSNGPERLKSEKAQVESARNGRTDALPASGVFAVDAGHRTLEEGVR